MPISGGSPARLSTAHSPITRGRRTLGGAARRLSDAAGLPRGRSHIARTGERGARLAILSNGSPGMLASAIAAAKLDGLFDAVFSVDAIRTYKTHPDSYGLVTQAWGVEAAAVSSQSSNRWDIAGATRFGFRWVLGDRSGQPDEYGELPPQRRIDWLVSCSTPELCFSQAHCVAAATCCFFHQGP